MAPTVHECVGGCNTHLSYNVKEYVRYRLGEFPFTTARKINHTVCTNCRGLTNADTNKDLLQDMAVNRKFIADQDKLYHVQDSTPIIPINGYVQADGFEPLRPNKQWHTGFIHYLRYLNTNDSVKIVPASVPYTIYCNSDEKLSTAAKQFVKPDDYFKLTSIV